MKTVIFGGSGFLGSHVADALTNHGHEVAIFDLKKSEYLLPNQTMIIGDMLDKTAVSRAIEKADCVYHFAGFADLNDAATQPLETVKQNILGTVTLLEAAAQARVKRFVCASTIYVYSQRGGFYRCSKQAAELYIEEFKRRHNLDYTILRYGTLYGPRADARNSMWRLLQQGLSEKKIVFDGTGEEVREYVHVRDAAKLSVDILSDEFKNKHIIITGHHSMKVKDVLHMMQEILNNQPIIEFTHTGNEAHYEQTPYSFIPRIGKKLVSNYYEDMGQGLLECLSEMEREHASR